MRPTLTLTIDRSILEHRQAVHLRRMHAAVWLYLVLLARLPKDSDTLDLDPRDTATSMGLPEGTVLSWLGHLRKHHYIEARRLNGTVRVRVKHLPEPAPAATPPKQEPARFFSVEKLAASLGEGSEKAALEDALAKFSDETIRRALAKTIAVPASEIRRSRTALFLYLLKHYDQEKPSHPRP